MAPTRKLFCFLLFLSFYIPSFAQTDSCSLRISLLTCSPGTELYSTFGHTALRVQDATSGQDLVFNFGTFEFNSDFYIKFVRGKLLYYLSIQGFNDFMYAYQYEQRSVVEQVLQLSCTEQQKLYVALLANAREENRYYRYDFLFDNCTTRARDMVARHTASPVLFKNILPPVAPTFRHQIHTYLNRAGQHWSKLGIDLLLGSKLDKKVNNEQAMFLPEYLMTGFDKAEVQNHPLVKDTQPLLSMPSPSEDKSLFTPFVVFSIVFLAIVILSISASKGAAKALKVFDAVFFFILGSIGVLLLVMWFATEHVVCRNNYNLLWALPTHLAAAIALQKKAAWTGAYFKTVFFLSSLVALLWYFLPQQMNEGFLPLLAIIIVRSWFLTKRTK